MKRLSLVLLLAATAACSSGTTTVGARFMGPAAIVQFSGVTRNGAKQYLAVADARGSDLRLIDPTEGQPVLGPSIIYPLSIITLPRPLHVAAASLGDGGADVLVSASAGEPTLEVVETWTAQNRVSFDIPLAGLVGAQAEILTMVGLTVTPAGGTPFGRILVSVSGNQLVVVDFIRATDGSGAVVQMKPTPDVQQLGFEALDLSVGPNAQGAFTSVYAATRDPLSLNGVTVHGVVEIDASAAATPLTTTVYDALAPTVAVAAAFVDERITSTSQPCAAEQVTGQPIRRVYAVLDPDGCGSDHAIACGVATINPARIWAATTGSLELDPAALVTPAQARSDFPSAFPSVAAQSFRAPMPIQGVPLHIAIANAPSKNSATDNPARIVTTETISVGAVCQANGSPASPLGRVLYGTNFRATSALAAVTSMDGHVYWLDLSRFAPVVDSTPMVGLASTMVLSSSTDVVGANQWQIGLWFNDAVVGKKNTTTTPSGNVETTVPGTVVVDAAQLPNAIEVWPGFTPTSVWTVTYQGALPGLAGRPGVVAPDATGVFVGLQSQVGSDASKSSSWSVPVQVDDPARGVRVGDIVTFPDLGCEATVASIVPRSTDPASPLLKAGVAFPGGALQLAAPLPPCLASVAAPAPLQITVLGGEVVVSNDVSGYVGRAPISLSTTDPSDNVFALAWKDESTLAGEDLAVARRARRIFYPTDGPCPLAGASANTASANSPGCYSLFPRLADPLSPAPAVRFRLGLRNITTPTRAATAADRPPRGATLHITTHSGLTQTSRIPTSGGTPPAAVVAVDPGDLVDASNNHSHEDYRFYVTYQDDQVAWFWTTSTTSQVTSIR